MGIEYKLRVETSDEQTFDGILRQGPFFANFDAQYGFYNFRHPSNTHSTQMPDLVAAIECDGIYICDKGSKQVAEEVMVFLKASLERMFGPVSLEEL